MTISRRETPRRKLAQKIASELETSLVSRPALRFVSNRDPLSDIERGIGRRHFLFNEDGRFGYPGMMRSRRYRQDEQQVEEGAIPVRASAEEALSLSLDLSDLTREEQELSLCVLVDGLDVSKLSRKELLAHLVTAKLEHDLSPDPRPRTRSGA